MAEPSRRHSQGSRAARDWRGARSGAPRFVAGAGRRGPKAAPRATRAAEPSTARRASSATLGGEQVEGRQSVRELLRGTRAVIEVLVGDELGSSAILDEIERLARQRRVPLRSVGARRLASLARTDAPQGVIAMAAPLEERQLEELATESADRPPFVVVLDGVTDPHNLGAILRTASCAGATAVVLGRHRAAHVTPTVAKVAAGAIEHLRFALVPGVPGALAELERLGVWSVGLSADGAEAEPEPGLARGPIALVLGSEGRGLSALARRRCDVLWRLPMAGPIESLNVAAAAAVACFAIARSREPTVDQPRRSPMGR
jgi:23S rRNA (guanosine2251-2'-O)-methyltransferase